MKEFKINEKLNVVCEWKKTRTAFKHEATLLCNGVEQLKVKCCYQNRTWESYEFQTVLRKLLNKSTHLTEEEKKDFADMIENPDRVKEQLEPLKTVGSVMALGEVFGTTLKEKNDWKMKMLKAGTENKGLLIPEDWDSLDEETKEARLNAITEHLNKIGA